MPAFADAESDQIASALTAIPSGTPTSAVTQRLLDLFTGGSIEPGTRLPPERQLASSLGVGRSAVREALSALEILGIIDVRPGSGTYLRGTASDLLPQTLRWGLLIGQKNTAELLELRSGLEIYVARVAATRADAAAIETIAEPLDRMRSNITDLGNFARADLDFHHSLAGAAQNALLTDLLHVARSLLRVYADRAVHDQDAAHAALVEHEAVYDAIVRQDPDGAASAMAIHMSTATARLIRGSD